MRPDEPPGRRPSSARSIEETTRQRLQNLNARRVYVVENGLDQTESDLALNPSSLLNTSEMSEINSSNGDTKGQFPQHSLKSLVIKQVHKSVIEVRVRCIFLRVGEIDTVNERFYAEVLLEASWIEPALKGLQHHAIDPSVHWTPQLSIMNAIGQLQDAATYTVRYDKQGQATVTEHHKLKGTFWERMELHHFPMDVQDLSVSVSTSHTNVEMIFLENSRKASGVNRQVFTDEQEWYLFEHVDIEISEQLDEFLDNGRIHSVVTCSCHAARKYGYFMWNAYFLIFLITSASFTTFPIPLANVQGRVQIGCTLLLTSITFRWSCNRSLPTISYLTAVDVYAIGSIFSLCLLNIFHGVIGYVNYYISTNTTNSTTTTTNVSSIIVIDRWALVIFTILFFAYQIGTFIWMYLVPWEKRRMMFRKDQLNSLNIKSRFNDTKATFTDVLLGAKKTFNERHEIPLMSNAVL